MPVAEFLRKIMLLSRVSCIGLVAMVAPVLGPGKATAQDIQTSFGGRIQNDWSWFIQNVQSRAAIEDVPDGTEFRRVRFDVSGTVYGNIEFKVQYDFAGGDVDFKDVWIGLKGIPGISSLRIGHHKEPFSLEELTSSNYISFLERALPVTFAPSRNTGVSVRNAPMEGRLTWALGIFRDADANGSSDGGYNVTGRLTGLPWTSSDGSGMLHLGIAFSRRNPIDEEIRYRARPEMHLTPRLVDTGFFAATSVNQIGWEVAFQRDRFSVQGEHVVVMPNSAAAVDPTFSSSYLRASIFLTADSRRFKRSSASYDRIRPVSNFLNTGDDRGWGAWEVVLQFSTLDLTDQGVTGGELTNFSVGLNWYLNPNTRMMLDYVTSEVGAGQRLSAVMTRLQLDF